MALESIKNHFSGLPMESLIGSPLKAACDAQVMLARSTVDFIKDVGFEGEKTRTADFSYTRHVVTGKDGLGNDIIEQEDVGLEVPVLAIVNIPNLMVDEVDITFDMEVKSSETSSETNDSQGSFSANAKVGWGPLSVTAKVSGSVSSHKENTRSSDNSAKYHVNVHASQAGTPEGLSRVLDIIQDSVAPKSVEGPNQKLVEDKNIKGAADKVVFCRKQLESAKSELKLANMQFEAEKQKSLADKSEGKDADPNKLKGAEKRLSEAKQKVADKEIALQSELNDLEAKINKTPTTDTTAQNTSTGG
ncbi:DUF2589 domain-containing protein [Vibrio europaeus]|uniref:DUF2589 domain-containing protein n=1 Tax=Vibrio europaeus TaxID=300876 RepID=UPI00233F317D|nr:MULTISPECIES: DUF2589 domain-containing protein [Vibrio oreintalis group]MDC5721736.1 DUF2589 domain-containing protein [Vibrio europaeus]MDC5757088.1 DUF2589 domain-containing protein [Vibrio europaeus]MDC5776403.1 DUF2589 domain-containing protein [Vibrio europaeus]MDC5795738.1 DUF2589 domain-containing protein [Vibrio europaeus]MDC5801681.1 DUF2589 domain-containing protein [Vibrio europaeus]